MNFRLRRDPLVDLRIAPALASRALVRRTTPDGIPATGSIGPSSWRIGRLSRTRIGFRGGSRAIRQVRRVGDPTRRADNSSLNVTFTRSGETNATSKIPISPRGRRSRPLLVTLLWSPAQWSRCDSLSKRLARDFNWHKSPGTGGTAPGVFKDYRTPFEQYNSRSHRSMMGWGAENSAGETAWLTQDTRPGGIAWGFPESERAIVRRQVPAHDNAQYTCASGFQTG